MTVVEFWEMRLKDFFLKLHYYNGKKQRDFEAYANLIRLQTVTLVNVQMEKKNRIRDPKKLWIFPWEVEEPAEPKQSVKQMSVKKAINLSKYL